MNRGDGLVSETTAAARAAQTGGAVERLAAHLDRQEQGLTELRRQLDVARSSLSELAALGPVSRRDEIVSAAELAEIVARLIRHCSPTIRSMVQVLDTQPGAEQVVIDELMRRRQDGLSLRTIYPADRISTDDSRRHREMWAAAGEEQRILASTPTEFAIFGSDAVISVLTWGEPDSGYLVIRDPLHIESFTLAFDLSWASAIPLPDATTSSADDRLLDLLGLGLKDEGIARYLGLGVRTVRRRIAALMEQYSVETRYQLGFAVARRRDPAKVR